MNQLNVTVMIINEKITDYMIDFDLFQPGKFAVTPISGSLKCNDATLIEKYLMDKINVSFDRWYTGKSSLRIAAIKFKNIILSHAEVKIISDGKNELFLPEEVMFIGAE